MSTRRAQPVGPVRRKPGPPSRGGGGDGGRATQRHLDLYHMLSAVVGAYVGLVFYTLITPGQIPRELPAPTPDPRLAIQVEHLAAKPSPIGLFDITGDVRNASERVCRLAGVTIRFLAADGQEVNRASATVLDIPPKGSRPFELRATAQGAVRFEAGTDLAQF